MTTTWTDTSWMSSPDKACVDEPASTFFPESDDGVEPPYPSPRASGLCGQCQFRPECLRYALDNDIEFGVWGGMSGYQRGLLGRKINRKRCPNCQSPDVVVENSHELCLACGTSWDIF
jgi:Transcription factor WhiB.